MSAIRYCSMQIQICAQSRDFSTTVSVWPFQDAPLDATIITKRVLKESPRDGSVCERPSQCLAAKRIHVALSLHPGYKTRCRRDWRAQPRLKWLAGRNAFGPSSSPVLRVSDV